MKVDFITRSTRIVPLSNCTAGGIGDQDTSIVTLSPDMLVPDHLQGKEFAFPFLFELHRILEEKPEFMEALKKSKHPSEMAYEELTKKDQLPPGPLYDWEFVKRVWSLFLNGRHDVCTDYIDREYTKYRFDEKPDALQVIYSFCTRIGHLHAREVLEIISQEVEVAREKNQKQLIALRDYYFPRFAYVLLEGTYDIISEYMKHYSEYSQMLIYLDSGASIGEFSRPSSTAFDDTKMFYGNAFEHLTSHLVLLACLNNIVQGRNYDTFEMLTLKEYLDLDKASKARSLQQNKNLNKIVVELNNKIRNASHHRRMRFDANTGTIVYQPSKSGDYEFITYGEYLILCNQILQTIAGFTCFVIAVLRSEELSEQY